MYTIIIPNRFPDIIEPLINSIHKYTQKPVPRILIIADGHENSYGFEMIPYREELFIYSRSVNLGIHAAENDDVFLINDDIVLLEPNTFHRLDEIGNSRPEIGLISPMITGGVNNEFQRWHMRNIYWRPGETLKYIHGTKPICFPCVWIKRKLINIIGGLDETITGYGGDDTEFCIRSRKAGFRTAITSSITVQHGTGNIVDVRGDNWNTSYLRRYPNCLKR